MSDNRRSRAFEVSFRADLTDREVDEVADKLFEMGYDDICFRPLADPDAVMAATLALAGRTKSVTDTARADTTRDRDALRDALQHETQRGLKW
jgi:hypothetical protein